MGVSFAIPIEVAMNTARQLRETGHVSRGQLGVAIQNVDRKFAKTLGLDRSVGALVSSVTPDSAAEKAGIKVGDRSEEHTSELQSLMRISYAVFCLKKKQNPNKTKIVEITNNK